MSATLRTVFWLGVGTLFVPFLGVTNGIRTALTVLIGALIVWLSFRLRAQYKEMRFRLRRVEEPSIAPEVTTEAQ